MVLTPFISCHNLSFSYGSNTLFENVTLAVHPGDRWGIIGANGTGKSTFLKLLAGKLTPDKGDVALRAETRMAYIEQSYQINSALTVEEILRKELPLEFDLDAKAHQLEAQIQAHLALLEVDANLIEETIWAEKLSLLQHDLEALQGASTNNIIESSLKIGKLKHISNQPFGELSGGEQKRVQIVANLLKNPQLILLDEPTNHLDIETVEWLEEFLLSIIEQGIGLLGIKNNEISNAEPFSFILVSHDRALLDTLVNKIMEIDAGESFFYQGNYEQYTAQKVAQLEQLSAEQQKTSNLFRRELAWLRSGTKARTTKQSARIERAYAMEKKLNKLDQKVGANNAPTLSFQATMETFERDSSNNIVPQPQVLSNQELVKLEKATIPHPNFNVNQSLLFHNFDLLIKPGTRIALVGPNGCGKSTLLNLIVNNQQPTSGKLNFHANAKLSYFTQHRNVLNPEQTIKEFLTPKDNFLSFNNKQIHINAYLELFLFARFSAEKQIKLLSGGEQARLVLAKLMLEDSNLLLLDEPTNDLDISTLQVLESSLRKFPGGIIFTSHDRYFLQRVATSFLVLTEIKNQQGKLIQEWLQVPDLDQVINLQSAQLQVEEKKIISETKLNYTLNNKAKNKNSYEQKELKKVEEKIAQLEREVEKNNAELIEVYSTGKPYAEVALLEDKLKNLKDELNTCYTRWEELFVKLN